MTPEERTDHIVFNLLTEPYEVWQLQQEITNQLIEVEKAATAAERERLKPWLRHKAGCAKNTAFGFKFECTCGLDKVLGEE